MREKRCTMLTADCFRNANYLHDATIACQENVVRLYVSVQPLVVVHVAHRHANLNEPLHYLSFRNTFAYENSNGSCTRGNTSRRCCSPPCRRADLMYAVRSPFSQYAMTMQRCDLSSVVNASTNSTMFGCCTRFRISTCIGVPSRGHSGCKNTATTCDNHAAYLLQSAGDLVALKQDPLHHAQLSSAPNLNQVNSAIAAFPNRFYSLINRVDISALDCSR